MDIGDRIRYLRGGLSRADFGDKIGVAQSTVQNWENNNYPKGDALLKIRDALNVDIEWLLTGEGKPYKDKSTDFIIETYDPAPEPAIIRRVGDPQNNIDPKQFAYVPLVKSKLSAGNGSFETDDQTQRHYAFRKVWLSSVASAVRNLVLVFVQGDSMEPIVCHGDMVMIDRGRTTIFDGAIYAIGVQDAIYLKKLVMSPDGVVSVVSEDEKRYPPLRTHYENLRIIGQIIWIARQLV